MCRVYGFRVQGLQFRGDVGIHGKYRVSGLGLKVDGTWYLRPKSKGLPEFQCVIPPAVAN